MRKFRGHRILKLIPFLCRKFANDLQFELRKQRCSPIWHVDDPANRLKRLVEAKDEVQFLTQFHLIRAFDPVEKIQDMKRCVEVPIKVGSFVFDLADAAHAPLQMDMRIHRRREGFKAKVVALSDPEFRGRQKRRHSLQREFPIRQHLTHRLDCAYACFLRLDRLSCAKDGGGTLESELGTTH